MAKTQWSPNKKQAKPNNDGGDRKRIPVGGMYINPDEAVDTVKQDMAETNLKIYLNPGTQITVRDMESGEVTTYEREEIDLRVFVNDRPKDEKSYHLNLVGYVEA